MKRESQRKVLLLGLFAIVLSILAGAGSALAVTASPEEMRQVAENWVTLYIHETGN